MTNPSHKPTASRTQTTRWTPDQIRRARMVPLVPLLQGRGIELIEHGGGNFEPANHPGLMIKDSYWRWPQRNMSGNTIDYFTQVVGLSFHDAMKVIL